MMKLKIKKSKFLTKAEYNPLKATLVVTFKNGKKYSFKGIDHLIFNKFRTKKKPSKFFKKQILGTYIAQEIKL